MRFLLGAVFGCLVLSLHGQDSAVDDPGEKVDSKTELKEWKREHLEGDLKKVVKRTADPFRQWSDGTVDYVAKVAWEQGQEPADSTEEDDETVVVVGGFTVLDVSKDGAMVQLNGVGPGYVWGMTKFAPMTHTRNLMLKRSRSYTYETVLGSVRRLKGFEYGQPITEKDYLEALDSVDATRDAEAAAPEDSSG